MSKISFWAFSELFEIVYFRDSVVSILLILTRGFKGFRWQLEIFGRACRKIPGKIGFLVRGVHSLVFGCLGENGQNINLHKFLFLCFVKMAFSQKFVCVGAENTIFSHMPEKIQKVSDAPAWGGNLHENVCFLLACLGLWSCCFCVVSPLGSKPSLFFVCFWFSWVFWCVCVFFWFGFGCSFSFENGLVCVF